MRKAWISLKLIIPVCLLVLISGGSTVHTQDFYVIPVGKKATGDATVDDVLKGKTFSNSAATGLTGKRYPAPVEITGQILTHRIGDDGYHKMGVSCPDPRFTAGANVVIDNLTGLMWQKSPNNATNDWDSAVFYCFQLDIDEGSPNATKYQNWRLPNRKELMSLIDYGQDNANIPVLPSGHPFTGVQTYFYWTSTTDAEYTDSAWTVSFWLGHVLPYGKDINSFHCWCVRDVN